MRNIHVGRETNTTFQQLWNCVKFILNIQICNLRADHHHHFTPMTHGGAPRTLHVHKGFQKPFTVKIISAKKLSHRTYDSFFITIMFCDQAKGEESDRRWLLVKRFSFNSCRIHRVTTIPSVIFGLRNHDNALWICFGEDTHNKCDVLRMRPLRAVFTQCVLSLDINGLLPRSQPSQSSCNHCCTVVNTWGQHEYLFRR